MDTFFQKIKAFAEPFLAKMSKGKTASALFQPVRDWHVLLLSSLALFTGLLLFGVVSFMTASDTSTASVPTKVSKKNAIDAQVLRATLDAYKENSLHLDALKSGAPLPLPPDPSR